MANNMFKRPPGSTAPDEARDGDTANDASTSMNKAMAVRQDMIAISTSKRQEAEEKFLALLDNVNSLDWEDLPVPVLAKMLMSKPIKGKRDEPDRYMTGVQALIYASACKALNAGCQNPLLKLNPWLNDMWVDLDTMKVNITVEGQRKVSARREDLGIPTWKEVTRKLREACRNRWPG